jgi:type I restriction enzyme R subunit
MKHWHYFQIKTRKTVLVPSFDEIKQDYEQAVEKLLSITPDYQTVDDLSLKISN